MSSPSVVDSGKLRGLLATQQYPQTSAGRHRTSPETKIIGDLSLGSPWALDADGADFTTSGPISAAEASGPSMIEHLLLIPLCQGSFFTGLATAQASTIASLIIPGVIGADSHAMALPDQDIIPALRCLEYQTCPHSVAKITRSTTFRPLDLYHSVAEQNQASVGKHLIEELRSVSGLTFEEIAPLLGVSRRTLHLWVAGSAISARKEMRLRRLLAALNDWKGKGPEAVREALFSARRGEMRPYDLLMPAEASAANMAVDEGNLIERLSTTETKPTLTEGKVNLRRSGQRIKQG